MIKYDTKTYKKLFDTVLNSKSNVDASEINKKPEDMLDFMGGAAFTTVIVQPSFGIAQPSFVIAQPGFA